MLDEFSPDTPEPQYAGSFQQLRDARRVLKVTNSLRSAPVLSLEDRIELERVRALAIRCIEAATAELIDTLDILGDDPDFEDATGAEDAFEDHEARIGNSGPGCEIADPDSAVDDRNCDDINMDLEPDTDAEVETWSHWMDHPPELHIGKRRGWNGDDPGAA